MGWLSLLPTSGGCSLWVATFGSNRSASPVKRYRRWSIVLCPYHWEGYGWLGRMWDGTTTHCRCRRLSVSTLLTLSVQYKYCTDN